MLWHKEAVPTIRRFLKVVFQVQRGGSRLQEIRTSMLSATVCLALNRPWQLLFGYTVIISLTLLVMCPRTKGFRKNFCVYTNLNDWTGIKLFPVYLLALDSTRQISMSNIILVLTITCFVMSGMIESPKPTPIFTLLLYLLDCTPEFSIYFLTSLSES
jgi:hypothetical protein